MVKDENSKNKVISEGADTKRPLLKKNSFWIPEVMEAAALFIWCGGFF
jgi:hypothetical protein